MLRVGEFVRGMHDWLSLEDYERAKEQSLNNVVSRYARGNISFQNGSVLDEDELRDLSEKADKSAEYLKQLSNAK